MNSVEIFETIMILALFYEFIKMVYRLLLMVSFSNDMNAKEHSIYNAFESLVWFVGFVIFITVYTLWKAKVQQ